MYSQEERPTSVRISDEQKMRLMTSTGTLNLTAAVRRIAEEKWLPATETLVDELKEFGWPEGSDGFSTMEFIAAQLRLYREGVPYTGESQENNPPTQ